MYTYVWLQGFILLQISLQGTCKRPCLHSPHVPKQISLHFNFCKHGSQHLSSRYWLSILNSKIYWFCIIIICTYYKQVRYFILTTSGAYRGQATWARTHSEIASLIKSYIQIYNVYKILQHYIKKVFEKSTRKC